MGKIITFANQKGGVGKTTSCINLSAYLAKAGYRVLILDMDPQGNASSGVGANKNAGVPSVYSVLIGAAKMNDKDLIQETKVENLSVLPSTINLVGAEVELVAMGEGRERVLKAKLEEAKIAYDYMIIDCPPSLGLLTVNALTASDGVIIPIQCEFFALEGLSQLMNTIRLIRKYLNPGLEIEGVLLTMFDGRARLSQMVAEDVAKFFSEKLFTVRIPRNIRLAEAPSYGLPINLYDPRSKGAEQYRLLALEVISRG